MGTRTNEVTPDDTDATTVKGLTAQQTSLPAVV